MKRANTFLGSAPHRLEDLDELDNVEPAFAIFVFRNERLRSPYLLGQDKLREAGLSAHLNEDVAQALMSG